MDEKSDARSHGRPGNPSSPACTGGSANIEHPARIGCSAHPGSSAQPNETMADVMRSLAEELSAFTDSSASEASDSALGYATPDARTFDLLRFIRDHNRGRGPDEKPISKKRLSAWYFRTKGERPERLATLGIDECVQTSIEQVLQVKPRRSASGVATVTVMAKPWPCGNDCAFCPNDLCMPKSYLSDEPVCQRAERSWFDPYLQTVARLRALGQMGHVIDKVELIVLGGSWCDYPAAYRRWFVRELFRALNDCGDGVAAARSERLRQAYRRAGIPSSHEAAKQAVAQAQGRVLRHEATYAQAFSEAYLDGELSQAWERAGKRQTATFEEVEAEQLRNVESKHRNVGLVFETRPETVTLSAALEMRRLGATKVQVGVQSLRPDTLVRCMRRTTLSDIRRAFNVLRMCGFKIHAHFMVNLPGATPETDVEDFTRFATAPEYAPDELKLYPCVMVAGTRLQEMCQAGEWLPYESDDLEDLLERCVRAVPPFQRISRMVRDISAHDILAGNRKANLRQTVERRLAAQCVPVAEIRFREIATGEFDPASFAVSRVDYDVATGTEHFFQWEDDAGRIAGFLRLHLPDPRKVASLFTPDRLSSEGSELKSIRASGHDPFQAMIREVHVYGAAAGLHEVGAGAQHVGFGRALIKAACELAARRGYRSVSVISAVGTRGYYRKLGFEECGFYQVKRLA